MCPRLLAPDLRTACVAAAWMWSRTLVPHTAHVCRGLNGNYVRLWTWADLALGAVLAPAKAGMPGADTNAYVPLRSPGRRLYQEVQVVGL